MAAISKRHKRRARKHVQEQRRQEAEAKATAVVQARHDALDKAVNAYQDIVRQRVAKEGP